MVSYRLVSQCPQCKTSYGPEVRRCPADGAALAISVNAPAVAAMGSDDTVGATPIPPSDGDDGGLAAGATVGEYNITGKIGAGGMGTVWAGVHPLIGKRVAVKVLNAGLSQDAKIVQRFVQEARAVNQIGHRNIVDIFAFGQLPSGRHYFVMEHLPGRSLKGRLAEPPPVSYEEALNILVEVCDALIAAHAEGIVHRDLKPDNIFLAESKTGERTVKLLDFGIAKLLRDESLAQTRTGQPMGTPLYMSPEQCLGKNVDHRSDCYSLGVIMFEMFTGQLPFPGPSFIETVNGHLQQPPPKPTEFADVPAVLESLILHCMEKDAAARPQQLAEVRQTLLQFADAVGVEVGKRKTGTHARTATPTPTPTRRPRATTTGQSAARAPQRPRAGMRPILIYTLIAGVAAAIVVGVVLQLERKPTVADGPPPAVATVALQIYPTPGAATVTINGRKQALLAPQVYQVPRAASYDVAIELDGYKPHVEKVVLAADEQARAIKVDLAPLKAAGGHLSAHTNAKKPAWFVDGKPAGTSERLTLDLPAGNHTLRVEAKPYEPKQESVDIQPNATVTADWILAPARSAHTKHDPAVATPPSPSEPKPAKPALEEDNSWPPK